MKREKVTYEEVATACKSLVERGDSPSVRNVLQAVGGGGSQTIAGHLTAWRQQQTATEEAREALTSQHISGELVQSLLREIARHKDDATEAMKRQIATYEDDANALREELAAAQQEIEQGGETLERTERELAEAKQQMNTQSATGTALLEESRRQASRLGENLEAALADLARERVAVAELRAAVATHQSRHEELAGATKRAVESEGHVRAEHKALQQRVSEMQHAVFEAEKRAAVATEQVNGRDAAIVRLEASLEMMQDQQRALADKQQAAAEKLEAALRRADLAEAKLHVDSQVRERVAKSEADEAAAAKH